MRFTSFYLLGFLLSCLCTQKAFSQKIEIDSITLLLKQCKSEKGFDTLKFNSARELINSTWLNDDYIRQLEEAGQLLKSGVDEDLVYLVRYDILQSLNTTDRNKAIEYAKSILQQLESSKTPHAQFLWNAFFRSLRNPYRNSNRISEGFAFYTEKLNQFLSVNDSSHIEMCYWNLASLYRNIGLLDNAIYNMKKSISYLDSAKTEKELYFFNIPSFGKRFGWINNISVLADYYTMKGNFSEAEKYIRMSFREAQLFYKAYPIPVSTNLRFGIRNLALIKIQTNELDSVPYFLNITEQSAVNPSAQAYVLQLRSLYAMQRGALNQADSLLQECWKLIRQKNISVNTVGSVIGPDYYLALVRIRQNKIEEAVALLSKDINRVKVIRLDVLRDYKLVAELYEKQGNAAKANESLKAFISLQDSVLADQAKFRTISFESEQKINENELSISKLEAQNKISSLTRNFTFGIVALLLLLVVGVYQRFRSKKKANLMLENTLHDLKATQSQLIQSEKMASLGELTAGIAHEIQNPLNFVNNFSDVNAELIVELKEELANGNTDAARSIAETIYENEMKIMTHGKRADGIVKGMLQHSRNNNSIRESTDINKLADEYLRLAFHGLRAKDKLFNANLETHFDESIGSISIIPQDIGRALINLINNAFYAVNEKNKLQSSGFQPTINLSTLRRNGKVEIRIKDNGNGIPSKVLDKIFQPFFTTKPTGQGTGLGLSLSYDIIKSHGGELKATTIEGEGSEFVIILPAS